MEPVSLVTALAAKSGEASLAVAKEHAAGFLRKLLGPSVDAIGESWAISHRERLFNNVVDVVARAKHKLDAAGVDPRQVPLKIIHPLLEDCSKEEEPDLREIWANLLANAADPNGGDGVRVAYAAMLKELTTNEVKLLNGMYEAQRANSPRAVTLKKGGFPRSEMQVIYDRAGLPKYDLQMTVDVIQRLGITQERRNPASFWLPEEVPAGPIEIGVDVRFFISDFGMSFILACRPPEPSA